MSNKDVIFISAISRLNWVVSKLTKFNVNGFVNQCQNRSLARENWKGKKKYRNNFEIEK
jgi:hypothetical protein